MRRNHDGETARQSKARRLMEMRRELPHMSASAVAAILAYHKNHATDDLPSTRQSIQDATLQSLPDTPYGKMMIKSSLVLKNGQSRDVHIVNPFGYLYQAFNQGGGFYKMFRRKIEQHPCSPSQPWRLAFYGDEIVPGNELNPENNRKLEKNKWL